MIGIKVCQELKHRMAKKEIVAGVIYSVFEHAFNIIEDNGCLASILTRNKSIAPLSVVIGDTNSFKTLGLKKGMKVNFHGDFIFLSEVNCVIDIKNADVWHAMPTGSYDRDKIDSITKKLSFIETFIDAFGNVNGVAPIVFNLGDYFEDLKPFNALRYTLSNHHQFIMNDFKNFIETLRRNNKKNIKKMVAEIVGFGYGLTPYVDDFISGLMLAFIYLDMYLNDRITSAIKINTEIMRGVSTRTNLLSKQMLAFSAQGKAPEFMKRFMKSLFSNGSTSRMTNDIINVLEFGNSSGTDMICGVYIGTRLLLEKNFPSTEWCMAR